MHNDITLFKFPKYKKQVWGQAVDEETNKYRLGLTMFLYALRMEQISSLSPCTWIVPVFISFWISMKGPIDELRSFCLTILGCLVP